MRPQIQAALLTLGPDKLKKISSRDIKSVQAVFDVDVPKLRKRASKISDSMDFSS